MPSPYSDADAAPFLAGYGPEWGEDLALRLYTSRLLGRDPALVLHGGGNTSVKTTARDLTGDDVEVLYVKGSGWTWPGSSRAAFPPAGSPRCGGSASSRR